MIMEWVVNMCTGISCCVGCLGFFIDVDWNVMTTINVHSCVGFSLLLCIAFTKNKYFVENPDLFLEKSARESP